MDKNRLISVVVGIILVTAVGSLVFLQKNSDLEQSAITAETAQDSNGATPTSSPSETAGISATEVAMHNSRQSCWSTINGSVYDLTSWIPKHPGGELAILGLCGIDGSGKFTRKHGGSSKQEMILSGFKIGSATK